MGHEPNGMCRARASESISPRMGDGSLPSVIQTSRTCLRPAASSSRTAWRPSTWSPRACAISGRPSGRVAWRGSRGCARPSWPEPWNVLPRCPRHLGHPGRTWGPSDARRLRGLCPQLVRRLDGTPAVAPAARGSGPVSGPGPVSDPGRPGRQVSSGTLRRPGRSRPRPLRPDCVVGRSGHRRSPPVAP